MTTYLPSKDLVLDACAGTVAASHPLLQAAYELASLHEARHAAPPEELPEIDCTRVRLIQDIDRWTARELPRPFAAATLHTETLGMVIDRLARFSVDARSALVGTDPESRLHHAWKRLAELSLAYADLSQDLTARTRRIPDSITPHPEEPGRLQM
ncbi:DUF4254 domain-containing protein [Nocardia aurantiaca]|uniref:DUF4254 domain-containing protein n=1 Tax=Nocardia aurantiaca TaxID=2675850 RepID=A0A6I3KW00_9NOCA|nr:DUF4254 domain-containing protein [Nocardia aurantiaca]MTE14172.1 DUF4254 domain-containing protein [Nocardia aurantiaca]